MGIARNTRGKWTKRLPGARVRVAVAVPAVRVTVGVTVRVAVGDAVAVGATGCDDVRSRRATSAAWSVPTSSQALPFELT